MKTQVIYLNGPSSCRKSTLSAALQEASTIPLLHIGIDKVIGMMPAKLNNWEGGLAKEGFSWETAYDEAGIMMQELKVGPFAKKMTKVYEQLVLTIVKMGHCLIVDDVGFGKPEVDRWKTLLKGFNVLYVGLFASLETLEKRESQRGDRMKGSARAQHKKVHQGVEYDLKIDTENDPLKLNAQKILSFL